MSRSRNIKPGFFVNEQLVELPFEARLLFIGLWTLADREGRLEDRPKKIKISLFPADSVDVDAMLTGLQDAGLIQRYEASGSKYLQVLNFVKHQNPHPKEAPSVIPPSENDEKDASNVITRQAVERNGEQPASPADSLLSDSPILIPDSLCERPTHNGSKSCFVPESWQPNPIQQRMARVKPGVDVSFELTQFRLHEFAQPKGDWDRAWVAWLNRASPKKPDFEDVRRTTVPASESKHPSLVYERQEAARLAAERKGLQKFGGDA